LPEAEEARRLVMPQQNKGGTFMTEERSSGDHGENTHARGC
jgi:hypothetical protein